MLVRLRGVAVRQRELEVLGEQLLDVGTADIVGLLNFDDLEDLERYYSQRNCRLAVGEWRGSLRESS